ncbi:tubulin epsilon chain-like isoform X2 [Chelonus insularis]|uniref:tubulin epsilon chain-like isoform X2 n=1 Tax=Chelonus insularis TaxID=460826 RepID=UPI00158A51A6|nr:tubulin epsilon chain-like isoform X2 [Chelonus insularis]
MSEFISIQVGQCGNQIGSTFWPLVLREYGILKSNETFNQIRTIKNDEKNVTDAFHSFFHVPDNKINHSYKNIADLNLAKVKARAILIDMEDSVVSRFKRGPLRNLFDQSCTITNYPGSGNNWAVGYHTHGRLYKNKIQNVIRKSAEKCDSLHGFLLMHSVGGGTGSGLGTATLNFLEDDYPNINKFLSSVYPTETSDVITAPYNKNQSSHNISKKPFKDMNSIIVNMLLHLTSGARFPGYLNTDMNDIATNLVPYPQLNYIFSSISPLHMNSTVTVSKNYQLQDELFTNVWSRSHQLLKLDPLHPKSSIIGVAYISRGDCSIESLEKNIKKFQKNKKFTPWSKEATKIGFCAIPPTGHPKSLLCLSNSTFMRAMFKNRLDQFNKLYKRKAYLHHYTQVEGFDLEHFGEAQESIQLIHDRYQEVENQKYVETRRLYTF